MAGAPQAVPPDKEEVQSKPTWFIETVTSIPTNSRHLLENYSGISPEDVLPHVLTLRDKAFAIPPYPCIGQLRFLSLNLSAHSRYSEVLQRLKTGENFLDVGCCFGQEIRSLVVEGVQAD
ncbi:MAG: hypothetical protein MMC33_004153 [Icmadophila ericetorum]|nr:hypothetical protein [Icmadophila ericetorum]